MEYFAGGLELGNCVFMQYEILADGGSRELSTKVIDLPWIVRLPHLHQLSKMRKICEEKNEPGTMPSAHST
jgi:hypothetical protein